MRSGYCEGLNRDQIVKIARLTSCKNFVGKRKKFIFNAFSDLNSFGADVDRSRHKGLSAVVDKSRHLGAECCNMQ